MALTLKNEVKQFMLVLSGDRFGRRPLLSCEIVADTSVSASTVGVSAP